jgi:hypothetical protein
MVEGASEWGVCQGEARAILRDQRCVIRVQFEEAYLV